MLTHDWLIRINHLHVLLLHTIIKSIFGPHQIENIAQTIIR